MLRRTFIAVLLLLPTPALAFPLGEGDLAELRNTVFSMINESRTEEGLPPLEYSIGIGRVAQAHADDTASHFDPADITSRERSYLAHTSSDGRALNARYRDANVETGWAFAENTGYWTREPFGDLAEAARFGLTLMHEGMMAEVPPNDAHRRNILGNFTHIGIGLSLLNGEEAGENVIFMVSNFSRYTSEEEERALRKDTDTVRLPATVARAATWPAGRQGAPGARSLLASIIPSHGGPFTDVRPTDGNAAAIAAMKERGIIAGYPDGTFRKESIIARAELVKMLFAAVNASPIGREFNACFSDVFNQWFAPYVCIAKREGWVQGYPDGSFRPQQTVTRAEGVTLAARVLKPAANPDAPILFDDAPPDSWFSLPLQTMAGNGFLPFEGTTFHPSRGMTRGEVAEMLHRALKD